MTPSVDTLLDGNFAMYHRWLFTSHGFLEAMAGEIHSIVTGICNGQNIKRFTSTKFHLTTFQTIIHMVVIPATKKGSKFIALYSHICRSLGKSETCYTGDSWITSVLPIKLPPQTATESDWVAAGKQDYCCHIFTVSIHMPHSNVLRFILTDFGRKNDSWLFVSCDISFVVPRCSK